MRLAHRHRQPALPGAVELAEPRIAIPAANSRASSTASVMLSGKGQVNPAASNRWIVNRTRRRRTHPPGDRAGRHPGQLQSDHIAHVAHRKPLRRHPRSPFAKPKGRTVWSQKRPRHPPGDIIPEWWARSLGMLGDIKSERWARSFRNGGRHRAESALVRT
jgi:hypothetical protein